MESVQPLRRVGRVCWARAVAIAGPTRGEGAAGLAAGLAVWLAAGFAEAGLAGVASVARSLL